MKPKTKPPVGSLPTPGTCFVPLPTPKEINAKWCAKTKTKKIDNGANSHVELFAQIMERMHATKKSFTFSDLVYICRGASMELPEIRRHWESWKAHAVQNCVVDIIQGCMDEETVVFNF